MKVYKFGGASVKDADGVRNLGRIVSRETGDLVIVVSAMGKTTNALERVVEALYKGDRKTAEEEWTILQQQHGRNDVLPTLDTDDYDKLYDQIVSNGELWSTKIVAEYLNSIGVEAHWVDMTQVMVTDTRYREANV